MAASKTVGNSNRIISLDALRGLAIAGMCLGSPVSPFRQLRHVEWEGLHLLDVVYPLFLLATGCSLTVAAARFGKLNSKDFRRRTLFRLVRLYAIGVLLRAFTRSELSFGLGTLQCIALASALALPWVFSSARVILVTIGLWQGLYLLATFLIGLAQGDLPSRWDQGTTVSQALDLAVLGKTRDEEGIVATLSAVTYVLAGILLGRQLRADGGYKTMRLPLLVGLALLVLSLLISLPGIDYSPLWSPLIPAAQSPAFVCAALGVCLLLYTTIKLLEATAGKSVLYPLIILGSNSLIAYLTQKTTATLIVTRWRLSNVTGTPTIGQLLANAAEPFLGDSAMGVVLPLCRLTAAGAVCWYLWKRQRYVSI